MGRIDQEAADRELAKAAELQAHADELVVIASALREEACYHQREAAELCGQPPQDRR
jgi:hypothetical protein